MDAHTAYWFTNKRGDWQPKDGYNIVFAEIVRLIRTWYRLVKVKPGVEQGIGQWVECQFSEGTVYVTVDKFTWNTATMENDSITPILLLTFRLARNRAGDVFYQGTLEVHFPDTYPNERPAIRVKNPRYYPLGRTYEESHSHHIYQNGWMCLTETNDWNRRRDTIITALNWAWEWILFHHTKFGW